MIFSLRTVLRQVIVTLLLFFVGSGVSLAENRQSLFDLPLSWQDDSGKVVRFSDWEGRSVILTMAYTRCKSACPITYGRLKKIEKDIEKENKQAEIVVVSFDTVQDTPAQLASFRGMHGLKGSHWHLLSGTSESVRMLSVALGISYQEDATTKEFSHSNKILLVDGSGQVAVEVEGLAGDTGPIVLGVGK